MPFRQINIINSIILLCFFKSVNHCPIFLEPGFHLHFLCLSLLVLSFSCPFWFFQLRDPLWLFVALGSFLLLFIAFRRPSLLFLAFHCSSYQPPPIGPEVVRMYENGNEKCSLLLFVARFGFWCVFPFAVCCLLLLFIALSWF